jgi:hypothetical protein
MRAEVVAGISLALSVLGPPLLFAGRNLLKSYIDAESSTDSISRWKLCDPNYELVRRRFRWGRAVVQTACFVDVYPI